MSRKRSAILYGVLLLSLFIVRDLPAADLLRQLDNSLLMIGTHGARVWHGHIASLSTSEQLDRCELHELLTTESILLAQYCGRSSG